MSIHPDIIRTGLEDRYNEIFETRMKDLAMVNPALQVEAVGFEEWEHCNLGVLITPWFINLVLVSCEGSEWNSLPVGKIQSRSFPSGTCEFVVSEEKGIGKYLNCPLASPMFDFASQEDALAVAKETLNILLTKQEQEEDQAPAPQKQANPGIKSISRRELLRGQFGSNAP